MQCTIILVCFRSRFPFNSWVHQHFAAIKSKQWHYLNKKHDMCVCTVLAWSDHQSQNRNNSIDDRSGPRRYIDSSAVYWISLNIEAKSEILFATNHFVYARRAKARRRWKEHWSLEKQIESMRVLISLCENFSIVSSIFFFLLALRGDSFLESKMCGRESVVWYQ